MPASPHKTPFTDGEFITSRVSSETLADVIAAIVTARSHRPLTANEEALHDDACREMRERIRETAAKRPNVGPNVITRNPEPETPLPAPLNDGSGFEHAGVNCPPPFPGPGLPKGWRRVRAGTADLPLRMTDKIWDGKKFVYVQNGSVVGVTRVDEKDFIIREIVGTSS